jgi:hypothetical protein
MPRRVDGSPVRIIPSGAAVTQVDVSQLTVSLVFVAAHSVVARALLLDRSFVIGMLRFVRPEIDGLPGVVGFETF